MTALLDITYAPAHFSNFDTLWPGYMTTSDFVNIEGTKSLPEPMLTSYQLGPVIFIWG